MTPGSVRYPAKIAKLAGFVDLANKVQSLLMTPNVIRSISARNHDAVVVRGAHFIVGFVGFAGVSEFAGVGLAGGSADGDDFRTSFLQAVNRVPDFHLLVHVVDQNRDSFAFKIHAAIVRRGREEAAAALAPNSVNAAQGDNPSIARTVESGAIDALNLVDPGVQDVAQLASTVITGAVNLFKDDDKKIEAPSFDLGEWDERMNKDKKK